MAIKYSVQLLIPRRWNVTHSSFSHCVPWLGISFSAFCMCENISNKVIVIICQSFQMVCCCYYPSRSRMMTWAQKLLQQSRKRCTKYNADSGKVEGKWRIYCIEGKTQILPICALTFFLPTAWKLWPITLGNILYAYVELHSISFSLLVYLRLDTNPTTLGHPTEQNAQNRKWCSAFYDNFFTSLRFTRNVGWNKSYFLEQKLFSEYVRFYHYYYAVIFSYKLWKLKFT